MLTKILSVNFKSVTGLLSLQCALMAQHHAGRPAHMALRHHNAVYILLLNNKKKITVVSQTEIERFLVCLKEIVTIFNWKITNSIEKRLLAIPCYVIPAEKVEWVEFQALMTCEASHSGVGPESPNSLSAAF